MDGDTRLQDPPRPLLVNKTLARVPLGVSVPWTRSDTVGFDLTSTRARICPLLPSKDSKNLKLFQL